MPPSSATTVPELPDIGKQPPNHESAESAYQQRLDHHPHEGEQAMGGIEPPNAADDEEPLLRASGECREDAPGDRHTRGKVVAARTIIRFGPALAAH